MPYPIPVFFNTNLFISWRYNTVVGKVVEMSSRTTYLIVRRSCLHIFNYYWPRCLRCQHASIVIGAAGPERGGGLHLRVWELLRHLQDCPPRADRQLKEVLALRIRWRERQHTVDIMWLQYIYRSGFIHENRLDPLALNTSVGNNNYGSRLAAKAFFLS